MRTKFGWTTELERWLEPFLTRLAHKTRRRMCRLYIAGLIGPGERKSIQPMAQRGEVLSLVIRSAASFCRGWCVGCGAAGGGNFLFRRSGLSAVTTPYW